MVSKMKAGVIGALLLVLLFAWMAVKIALIKTTIMWGGSMFMLGVLAIVAAVAIVMLTMRSRRTPV
jgi:hypothetical protein